MNLNVIAKDLFNKIRGRFSQVTLGDSQGKQTTEPTEARFFDFDFKEGGNTLGKVSISISEEDGLVIMHSKDFVEGTDEPLKRGWFNFLKELRGFAKARVLGFDTRDITKSNLEKRDYDFLGQGKEVETVSESNLYGTTKTSFQTVGEARLVIKHSAPVNPAVAGGRTHRIESLFIESNTGERFKYPFKHLNGARAMARHVSEGGNAYDDFGKYIVSLSEELNKLRKFKNYMGRSGVMAEGLQGYMDVVYERIDTVKKTIEQLQKPTHYKTAFEGFETPVLEDVPDEVASNWIDQLTIRQFNEELKDVFPYIYKLVNEKTKAKELGPEDLLTDEETKLENTRHDTKTENDFESFESWADDVVEQGLESEPEEGNKFTQALKKARDDDEDEMEVDGEKIPVTEFVLSLFDRETGEFPKGETAVLTAVEKDYGEQYITGAKEFIEAIKHKFEQHQMRNSDTMQEDHV